MTDKDVPLKILPTGVATIVKNNRVHTFVQGNLSREQFIENTKNAIKEL